MTHRGDRINCDMSSPDKRIAIIAGSDSFVLFSNKMGVF